MGVLDSSYIKALGVKSPGLKRIFFIFSDTLVDSEDDRADNLVVGLFVKRARGEEAAEERQAESRGEETEAE